MAKILNSNSELVDNSPQAAKEIFSLISNEKLLAIYAAMVKCRMLEQRATMLFQQGKLRSDLHASSGREASAAAVGVDLQSEDTLCIAPGDWLPAFVKGMSLEGVFRVLAPSEPQSDGPAAPEPAQQDILAPLDHALPTEIAGERAVEALAQKKGAIVVVFIAPGTGSLKPWQKMMAAASGRKLPIVFVHYVDQIPAPDAAGAKSRARNPEDVIQGMPAIAVDALDSVAVYRVACEAIVRGRQARGATLIECTVWPNSSSADGNKGDEEFRALMSADSLTTMESYLKQKAIEPGPYNRQIVESFSGDLDLATRFLNR